ncbi:thiopurine S-methyltransferase [Pseudidiomarina marina]|uniref:thiopurine S-methyltransferase n=1 Tax=Pseudidiomarina marina TaxID=502366 RepID=UPI00384F3603
MEHEFWHERWQKREIGFHRLDVHPLLTTQIESVAKPSATIFVPLCGKSLDMQWLLQQGYEVIGIELSEVAIQEFFTEHNLPYQTSQEGSFIAYCAEGICIYQGDFFDLTEAHLQAVSAWYDRAAMVALPPTMRTRYITHLQRILPTTANGLLVMVEYPEDYWKGPPFVVHTDEIRTSYQDNYAIDVLPLLPGFTLGGDANVTERGYLLSPKHKA